MIKNKPAMLKPNDTIGIVCPSYAHRNNERENRLVALLEDMGFLVKFGRSCSLKQGYLAGSDEERANDLMEMFENDEIKGILAMLGGYGTTRMVDLIDYDRVSKHPKLFMGYSDITVLLNALYQKANIPCAHGPDGYTIANPKADVFTDRDFKEFLTTNDLRTLENPLKDAITLNKGIAEGTIVGGNLSLIDSLIGTPYDIDFNGNIVFIEDIGEEPYRLDRMFSKLRLSGKLHQASGYVLGYFTGCEAGESKKDTQTKEDILREYFLPLGVPTIMNFSSGHEFPFITIPIGLQGRLDADAKKIHCLEPFYK